MRVIRNIPIEDISIDRLPSLKSCYGLISFLKGGNIPPPIKVVRTPLGYKIKDGRHRILSNMCLGNKTIKAKYYEK